MKSRNFYLITHLFPVLFHFLEMHVSKNTLAVILHSLSLPRCHFSDQLATTTEVV